MKSQTREQNKSLECVFTLLAMFVKWGKLRVNNVNRKNSVGCSGMLSGLEHFHIRIKHNEIAATILK